MPALNAWRVFDDVGDPLPTAVPVFLTYVSRTGVAQAPQPSIVNLGQGEFGFTPSAAQELAGVAWIIDNGALASNRYVFGAAFGQTTIPFASLAYFNPDGTLFSGPGNPTVALYDDPTGAARTPPAIVTLASPHFFALNPIQADMDAGGVAYVVDSPAGAEPTSYDGSLSTDTGWTYSPSLLTDKDKVRLLIGDTNSADRLLLDAEISFFLSVRSSIYLAAADAADAIAAKFSRQADTRNLSLAISASQRAEAYAKLALELRGRSDSLVGAEMFVGGTSIAEKQARKDDADEVQPSFEVGRDDLPGTDSRVSKYDDN